ncbi:hypothetical protein ALI22I_16140 [Saccharothrix sp. ALI-22-I]|uniref:hypothetical protein n=1 Tax=Saccharothrix sp. ALI-22-I TaxID=1933778 RepID=UPI00097C4679|nr:hypothetical protein [Saccharothrix sp. ALI-22-I]ONI89532.1 hypothetical protein ALI22I_16140 [Saccharothrix sp. ALI-22-I]
MGRKSALAGWLRGLDAQEIRDILALREDAADRRPHSLRALADELTTTVSLRAAVDGLDQACRDVLDTAVRLGDEAGVDVLAERLRCTGKASRAELKRALGQLRARALLWPAGDRLISSPGLRPLEEVPPRRITPAPRTPRRAAQQRGFADRAAIRAATSTVDGVTRLVELCDVEHVVCRVGVGLRELRRVAGVLRTDEVRARLWVELAVEARLLAVDDGRLVPTGRSDGWRAGTPAVRLAALADAWPRMTWTRRGVLEHYGRLGEDEAYEHRHEVVAELVWTRPAVHDRAATEAALAEAESVGLVALGAPTALGRAVLAGRAAEVAEVADRFVPPDALERVVPEVARRHGRITVTPVACCVRAEDPVLLSEIAGHRSLARLSLQPLGPTVLASAKPAPETLALLRAAGYAPTTSTADGMSVLERVPRRRVEPPAPVRGTTGGSRPPLTGPELAELASALVERERPRPNTGTVRLLRDQSLVLRDAEVVLLAEALVTRTSVEIAVANGPRSTVKHVITPVDHAAGNLKANCAPRGEHREFPVSRIRSVRAVTGV